MNVHDVVRLLFIIKRKGGSCLLITQCDTSKEPWVSRSLWPPWCRLSKNMRPKGWMLFIKVYLPWTCKSIRLRSVPATLVAMHRYRPVSVTCADWIRRNPFSRREYLQERSRWSPSNEPFLILHVLTESTFKDFGKSISSLFPASEIHTILVGKRDLRWSCPADGLVMLEGLYTLMFWMWVLTIMLLKTLDFNFHMQVKRLILI